VRNGVAGQHRQRRVAKAASASATGPVFDRDEVVVCRVLAFAIGNALLSFIYRLTG
jgi:hypothetical protein